MAEYQPYGSVLQGFNAAEQFRQQQLQNQQASQMNQIKLSDLIQQQQEQKDLQGIMAQTGGDPVKAYQALTQHGTPASIALAEKFAPLVKLQQQKEQQAKLQQGLSTFGTAPNPLAGQIMTGNAEGQGVLQPGSQIPQGMTQSVAPATIPANAAQLQSQQANLIGLGANAGDINALKPPVPKPEDFNKPFLTNGQPNLPYQQYQKSLIENRANAGVVPVNNEQLKSQGAQIATGMPINQVIPGYGKAAVNQRLAARQEGINQIKQQTGMDDAQAGQELANRAIDYQAGKSSVNQLTKMLGATQQAVQQLDFNIGRTKAEMQKLGSTDLSPILNAIARGEEKWTGDPAYSSLFYYMAAVTQESARILSGGQASIAQLHTGAQEEAQKWANINMTPASFDAVAQAMHDEGAKRIGTFEDTIKLRRVGGSSPTVSSQPTTGIPAGWSVKAH